jgi:hypothetical protein
MQPRRAHLQNGSRANWFPGRDMNMQKTGYYAYENGSGNWLGPKRMTRPPTKAGEVHAIREVHAKSLRSA